MVHFNLSAKKIWRERKLELLCGSVCVLAVVGLISILVDRYLYVKSSNAVMDAYFVPLSSQVAGEITQVFVHENEKVEPGQILCQIDDRLYKAALFQAESNAASVQVQWSDSKIDLKRLTYLVRRHSIDRSSYDRAVANEQSLEQQYRSAQAKVTIAKSNLDKTWVIAPDQGRVVFRSARIGLYASPGFPLFGFIATQKRWVTAKIRETDLKGIQIGDAASVQFDSDPGHSYPGHVESVAPSSETPFAAVPDDFSAGNFTKYPQWFPIRIKLDLDETQQARLPIGINSKIRIHRRHT